MTSERITELVSGYLDGPLSQDAAKELLDAFQASPETKARFICELKTSNLIYGLNPEDNTRQRVVESIQGESTADNFELKSVPADAREQKTVEKARVVNQKFRMGIGIAAAIAGVLLGGIFLTNSPEVVATLVHTDDAVWGGGNSLEAGSDLAPGVLKLKSGVATLKFGDAVRVTLEGPAEYELIQSDLTRLNRGTLNAHVLPDGVGFQVLTEQAKVIDLGTAFSVTVGDDHETEVAVFEGKVDVEAAAAGKKHEIINEGVGAKISDISSEIEQTALVKHAASKGWQQLFGVSGTFGKVRFVDAESITSLAAVRNNEQITVVPERVGLIIQEPVNVTIVDSGAYHHGVLKERVEELDIPGTKADSFLIQYNPARAVADGMARNNLFSGEIQFNRPVLAVITRANQLRATDKAFGKSRFDYDEGVASRGIESGDRIELSADRKTLVLKWRVKMEMISQVDQIRVLVESD